MDIEKSRDNLIASGNGHLICICKQTVTVEPLFSLRKALRWLFHTPGSIPETLIQALRL